MEKKDMIKIFSWLAVLVFFEFWALYFVQKSQKVEDKRYLIFTMLLYGIPVSLLLYKLLDFKTNIGIINFLWNVFSTLSGIFIACYLFKAKVNHLEWMGVALGFLSIGLIIMGGNQKGGSDNKQAQ
jgi:multidrug transporter EmrE-like cation transporter